MAVESSEEDFCLRGDLTSDPCLKRMAVWRRDAGKKQAKGKRVKQRGSESKKGPEIKEWRMQDLGKRLPVGAVGESAAHDSQRPPPRAPAKEVWKGYDKVI